MNDAADATAPRPDLPGYDVAAVEGWIAANTDGLTPPFTWTRLEGGHSNLTYALTDTEGRRAVVRRPPLGELLPKAHDMGREFRVISGLNKTDVPVPIAYGYCEDPSVTGAHFYVMSMVEGRAMYTPDMVEAWLPLEARKTLGLSFMDTLAALHAVDPADVGLADLGRHDGYVARQLRTWYGSWEASKDGADYDDERVHRLRDHFGSNLPEQGPARVVHGDYGLHNAMVAADGHVTAVLDWEIATLGDPLADFAYALNGWGDPTAEPTEGSAAAMHSGATTAPGFDGPDVLVARYAERSGRDLGELEAVLPYYRAFNYFKTGCIIHGVYSRYQQGKKSAEGVDLEALKTRMIGSIDLAEQWAEAGAA